MKVPKDTSMATFLQFGVVSLFALLIQIVAVVQSCFKDGTECVGDIIPSIWYFILTAMLFFAVWYVGHSAQEKREKKWLAVGLIVLEAGIARIAYHNAKHHPDVLSLVASIANIVIAIWVIILAIKLFRSKGGRIVHKQRPRVRKKPTTD